MVIYAVGKLSLDTQAVLTEATTRSIYEPEAVPNHHRRTPRRPQRVGDAPAWALAADCSCGLGRADAAGPDAERGLHSQGRRPAASGLSARRVVHQRPDS